MIGQIFGRLTVLSAPLPGPSSALKVLCRCECGNERPYRTCHLRSGATRSCGCLSREVTATLQYKHGCARRASHTAEFNCWAQIRGRCLQPRNKAYRYYGGRGISMCPAWEQSFEQFLADVGERPSPGHSIDRIDVNGNYEPANCRWATRTEQSRNKRTTTLSEEIAAEIRALCKAGMSKAEVARQLGVNYSSVKQVAYGHQWAEAA